MGKLSAGIASSVITPPVGVYLTGYAGRSGPNTGVHDHIYAKALVLSDGSSRAAIVSLDLLGLDSEQVAQVRREVGRRTGIQAGSILIGASHTHSGPATQLIRACGTPSCDYVSDLLSRISSTVIEAADRMSPARIGYGSATADIAVNRRYRTPGGEVQIGENVGGPTDPEVGIWYVESDGKPLVVLFNHACHAVVLGGDNLLVSADWPGAAQERIEDETGAQAMFLQGCCGNINPGHRGTFEVVEQEGRKVADNVLGALPGIELRDDVELRVACEMIDLPLQPPISREQAERIRNENAAALESFDLTTSLAQVHIAEAYRGWASAVLEGRADRMTAPAEVQVLGLGDCRIVSLPGEVFVEIGLQIKGLSPRTMVAGYANGNIGYVPTRKAFEEGGYEVDVAYRLYGEQMITEEAEDLLLAAAGRLLDW